MDSRKHGVSLSILTAYETLNDVITLKDINFYIRTRQQRKYNFKRNIFHYLLANLLKIKLMAVSLQQNDLGL